MGINFDRIPQNNPFVAPAIGFYRARVEKAVYTVAKTAGAKNYLALTYALLNAQMKKIGTVYDKLYESDSPTMLYKIGRFANALGLSLSGVVELKDLAKIVVNKEFVVEITHEADNRAPEDRSKDRAVPRIFGSEIFWPMSEASMLIQDEGTEPSTAAIKDDELPFSLEAKQAVDETETNGY